MHNLAQVGDKSVDLEVQVDVEKTHEDGSSEAVHVEGSLDADGDGDLQEEPAEMEWTVEEDGLAVEEVIEVIEEAE